MAAAAKIAKIAPSVPPTVIPVDVTTNLNDDNGDAVIVVAPFTGDVEGVPAAHIDAIAAIDASAKSKGGLYLNEAYAGNRLILAPTGPLTSDGDDVRSFADAAHAGVVRAKAAGAKAPILLVAGAVPAQRVATFAKAVESALLGALSATYVPVEVREDPRAPPSASATLDRLLICTARPDIADVIGRVVAIEAGRAVSRDICGGDPERMAPLRVAEYVEELFKGTNVTVAVEKGPFTEAYPLLAAVARCSEQVPRHAPCVINLEYAPANPEKTLFFVGKGVTYDTGGADVKAGGIMAGMHRDKGGAAAIAGFMRTVSILAPANVRVVCKMSMVRNSIGADAYVADEIIHSRAGVRTRVGNTDAEGRMAMADVLCKAKEEALSAVNPFLFTVATLTGHAVRAYGTGYFATMDNGPALAANVSALVATAGLSIGDPAEISTIRREDYAFIRSKYVTEDIVQCNNLPSSGTPRGHQFPAAFMIATSGMDKHGLCSDKPIPYTHMDIAGATQMWPTPVSGTPIAALTETFL